MALPPMEIRYSRRAFYPIIFFCIIWAIATTWAIYSFRPVNPTMITPFFHMISLLTMGFLMGWAVHTLWENRPVLTFHSQGLEFHGRKAIFIRWSEVTKWKIRTTKGGPYLDIRTANEKRSIALNMLERSSKTIEELVATYIRQPGPGGFQR